MNAFLSAKVYICIMSNLVTTWLSNYKDMYCEPSLKAIHVLLFFVKHETQNIIL